MNAPPGGTSRDAALAPPPRRPAYNSAEGARRHGGQKLTLVNRADNAAAPRKELLEVAWGRLTGGSTRARLTGGLQVPAIPLSTKRLQLSDCARLPPPRRGWTGPARIPPPQGPCEGREAMETVIVCAVTAVLSSAVTLVAYALCFVKPA